MTTKAPGEPAPVLTPNQNPPDGATTPQTSPAVRRDRVRDLHPGWFASVMGTAILAVATYLNPGNLTALQGAAHGLGAGLAVLAYALGAVLTIAYAVRWARHRDAALADLRHPVLGAMHATLPGGLLVLAVMTSVVGPELLPAGAVTALIAVRTARAHLVDRPRSSRGGSPGTPGPGASRPGPLWRRGTRCDGAQSAVRYGPYGDSGCGGSPLP